MAEKSNNWSSTEFETRNYKHISRTTLSEVVTTYRSSTEEQPHT